MYPRAQAGVAAYQAARETMSPAQIIILLYEGAIRKLIEAKDAIAEKRIEDRFNAVTKAHAIIGGLHSQLDFDAGGEVARTLDTFYTHVSNRMMAINLKNDPAICDELIGQLKQMHASWVQVAAETGAAPQQAGADGVLASA